jgi:hypothetical protein
MATNNCIVDHTKAGSAVNCIHVTTNKTKSNERDFDEELRFLIIELLKDLQF